MLLILASLCPAHFQRDRMGNFLPLSPNMILEDSENRSPEDLILHHLDQSKGMFSAALGNLIHLEGYPFKGIFTYIFHASVFNPKTAILRC